MPVGILFALAFAAQEPRITIPLGYYGYHDLADRMVEPGKIVEIPRRLWNRAALISIHDRPLGQARSLICRGLGLQASVTETGKLNIEEDPETHVRETKFANQLTDAIRSKVSVSLKAIADAADIQRLGGEAKARKHLSELKANPNPTPAEAKEIYQLDLCLAYFQQGLYSFSDRANAGLAALKSLTSSLLSDRTATVNNPSGALGDAAFAEVQGKFSQLKPSGFKFAVHLKGGFRSYTATCGWSGVLSPDNEPVESYMPLSVPFGSRTDGVHPCGIMDGIFYTDGSAYDPWPGLGAAAITWLEKSREKTRAFLQTPAATQRFTLNPRQTDCLTGYLEAWAKKTGGEVVCELSPAIEGFRSEGDDSAIGESALADMFSMKNPYTLRLDGGVLVGENQLAFLDHPYKQPLDVLAKLLTAMGDRWAPGPSPAPETADLIEGVVDWPAMREAMAPGWKKPSEIVPFETYGAVYHGMFIETLFRAHALTWLWDHWSPAARREMLAAVPRGEESRAIREITGPDQTTFKTLVLTNNDNLDANTIADQNLRVRWFPSTKDPKTVIVTLSILRAGEDAYAQPIEGPVSFAYKP